MKKWVITGTIWESWIFTVEAENEEEAIREANRLARRDHPGLYVDVESVEPVEEES